MSARPSRWNDVFARWSRESGVFGVRSSMSFRRPYMLPELASALESLRVTGSRHLVTPTMGASSEYERATYVLLDGGVYSVVGDPDLEYCATGTWIFGFETFRLLLDEMRLVPPRKLLEEPRSADLGVIRGRYAEESERTREDTRLQSRLAAMEEALLDGDRFGELLRCLAVDPLMAAAGLTHTSYVDGGLLVEGTVPLAVIPIHGGYYWRTSDPAVERQWTALRTRLDAKAHGDPVLLVVFGDDAIFAAIDDRLGRLSTGLPSLRVAHWVNTANNEVPRALRDLESQTGFSP